MCGTTGYSTRSSTPKVSLSTAGVASFAPSTAFSIFMRRRHDRVVLQAAVVEIGLLEHGVDFAAQRAVGVVELRGVELRVLS